jgi:microcystin-dependent protein
MKKMLSVFALVAAVSGTTDNAKAQAADPYMGQVMFTAANFCPRGWAPLDGAVLPLAQNTALFSLLGFNYGGNGTTTFQLPLIVPFRTSNGNTLMACIALQGVFPARPGQ